MQSSGWHIQLVYLVYNTESRGRHAPNLCASISEKWLFFNSWKNRHLALSWQDTDDLKSVHKGLNPPSDFTGETYISVSHLSSVLQLFKEEETHHDSGLSQTMKTTIIIYLNEKYKLLHQRWQGYCHEIQSCINVISEHVWSYPHIQIDCMGGNRGDAAALPASSDDTRKVFFKCPPLLPVLA